MDLMSLAGPVVVATYPVLKMNDIFKYDLVVEASDARDNSSSPELSPEKFVDGRRNNRSLNNIASKYQELEKTRWISFWNNCEHRSFYPPFDISVIHGG